MQRLYAIEPTGVFGYLSRRFRQRDSEQLSYSARITYKNHMSSDVHLTKLHARRLSPEEDALLPWYKLADDIHSSNFRLPKFRSDLKHLCIYHILSMHPVTHFLF